MSGLGNYYIHYHYGLHSGSFNSSNNATRLSMIFNEHVLHNRYKQSIATLKTTLKNTFIPKNNINTEAEEEFFKLLKDLEDNVLPKAATQMVQKLSTSNTKLKEIVDISKDISQTQQLINKFKNILKQMNVSTFINKAPLEILTIDKLNSNTNKNSIKSYYQNKYLSNNDFVIKVDDKYTSAINSHINEINKIRANIASLEEILSGSLQNFSNNAQSDAIKSLLFSTWSTLNRMIGFVSEDILRDEVELFLSNYIQENLTGSSIQVVKSGTGKSSKFNVKTEDISMQLNISEMLKNNSIKGQIKMDLPGITLKRTNLKNVNYAAISLKTNANLQNLISDIDSSHLQEFYQAYATYNMTTLSNKKKSSQKAELGKEAKPSMEMMYKYVHAAALPYALGGSLEKKDFAYFMIINNKVYNLIEIIEKVMSATDSTFIESNLSKHQTSLKNAHRAMYLDKNRSSNIVQQINSLPIIMKLNLQLNSIT